jgi:hypothetical protein
MSVYTHLAVVQEGPCPALPFLPAAPAPALPRWVAVTGDEVLLAGDSRDWVIGEVAPVCDEDTTVWERRGDAWAARWRLDSLVRPLPGGGARVTRL